MRWDTFASGQRHGSILLFRNSRNKALSIQAIILWVLFGGIHCIGMAYGCDVVLEPVIWQELLNPPMAAEEV